MIFFPFGVDVVMGRWPIANWVLILINLVVFGFQATGKISPETVGHVAYSGWNPFTMIAATFLHADIFHVLGNMLFLWTFGNPICAALGTWRFLLVYLFFSWFSVAVSLMAYGAESGGLGASGAINGIVGMYLVLFPLNDVSCFWYFFFRWGVIEIAGFWLVATWLGFDIYGAARGSEDGIGYWAHLGGFIGGVGLGFGFDVLGWTLLEPEDQCSILALATGRHQTADKPDPFRGRPKEALIRELPKSAKARKPPPPQDDEPIPMD